MPLLQIRKLTLGQLLLPYNSNSLRMVITALMELDIKEMLF